MERNRFFHDVPKWDYTPTGILVLSIDHEKSNQHKWTDGKKRIEDRLTSFAEVLVDVAKDVKESRGPKNGIGNGSRKIVAGKK
jgi:hypothetical protein